MSEQFTDKQIACRFWSKTIPVFWVANLPGDGGKDWGYSRDQEKAIAISAYWAQRFASYCRKVGSKATFYQVD